MNFFSRGVRTVFKKEVRENLRDRRSVTSSLVYGPLFGPLIFALMIAGMTKMEMDRAEKDIELPVVGAEHAPNLVTFLKQQGVQIKEPPDDPDAAVSNEEEDLILVIDERFGENLEAGMPAPVMLIMDRSRREARTKVQRIDRMLTGYGNQVGRLRLMARGIHPEIIDAVVVQEKDLSTPESRGALLLSMLPYFVILAVFMGGMYLAIDTTAGERERQSLEPLLITPPARWQVMSGKLMATIVFALVSLAITLVAFAIAMRLVPTDSMGMQLNLSASVLGMIFLVVAPVGVLASSLQTIIAAFAKSFREAQTYLSLFLIVPIVPSLVLFVVPMKSQLWMMTIPILSQNLLIEDLVRGEGVDPLAALVSIGSTLLAGILLGMVAARLYNREQLAFSAA